MNPLQIRAYLARIGVPLADDAPLPAPTLAWLERVQRAQALSVPFENCDQHSDAKLLTGEQLYAWGLNETGTASEFAQPIFDKIVVITIRFEFTFTAIFFRAAAVFVRVCFLIFFVRIGFDWSFV